METSFKQRVKLEKVELELKIQKLETFLNSPNCITISGDQKQLLEEQLLIMKKYLDILTKRLDIM